MYRNNFGYNVILTNKSIHIFFKRVKQKINKIRRKQITPLHSLTDTLDDVGNLGERKQPEFTTFLLLLIVAVHEYAFSTK